MNAYKKMREEHRPQEIHVLFIGESPPKPKNSLIPYFYNERENSSRRLYGKIAYALELREPKSKGLQDFANKRMWLTDIFDEPLKKVKAENVEAHLDRLLREIKETNPSKIITLLPKRRSNDVFLYFFKKQFPKIRLLCTNPWRENKEQFKKRLTEFLKDC